MCCLFGLIDCRSAFSTYQKNRIIYTLGKHAEVRGTDAAGIAYFNGKRMTIYKRPIAARSMHFRIPKETPVVMGHTRLTTQGNEKNNYNNHPFRGVCSGEYFALAHNGILFNGPALSSKHHLPPTNIQTDSYVIVQLLNIQDRLSFESLRYVAEQLEGTFTVTVLGSDRSIYFVRGNNPLCLYYFPSLGAYLYASTQSILDMALSEIGLADHVHSNIQIDEGDIIRIHPDKEIIERSLFHTTKLNSDLWKYYLYDEFTSEFRHGRFGKKRMLPEDNEYREQLYAFAAMNGISGSQLEMLEHMGYTLDELEELLYDPIALCDTLNCILCDDGGYSNW